jgi:hypothetical protein
VGLDEDAQGDPAWHAYSPALDSVDAATPGRTREEALSNINHAVRMIVRELPKSLHHDASSINAVMSS